MSKSDRLDATDEGERKGLPVREIGVVGLVAVALILFLAIASYASTDPGFSYSGQGGEVQNLVGSSGAYFADLVLYLFGWVAYLIPAVFLVAGLRIFLVERIDSEEGFRWKMFSARSLGWLLLLVSCCTLLKLHSLPESVLPAGAGGAFGSLLVDGGLDFFGWVGFTLLSIALALMGSQMAAGFSWLDVAEFSGKVLHLVWRKGLENYDRMADKIRVQIAERQREKAVQEQLRSQAVPIQKPAAGTRTFSE